MKRHKMAAVVALAVFGSGCVVLPEAQLPDTESRQLVGLDQGWEASDRELFYHQSQGTVMVPYDWFMALEQPEIKFIGEVGMFADQDYLARYGFLPSNPMASDATATDFGPANAECVPSTDPDDPNFDRDYNCGLPVGLSRADIVMPDSGVEEEVVGFTCAACHVGELHFQNVAIRIDGATNLVDVTQFQAALGGAMLLTQRFPFRFTRFAQRVLEARGLDEEDASYDTARAELRREVDAFMKAGGKETSAAIRKGLYADYPGGFGRTDALARIENMVFGTQMNNEDNLAVGSAPVKYPTIWDAPYFSWAQYNGSIEQSMVRNVGEALGTRAKVVYSAGGPEWAGEGQSTIASTVDIPGLFAIESLLRGTGDAYFNGLRSPIWPEKYLGRIDWGRAERGKTLYEARCQMCHLAPLADLVEVGPMPNGADGETAIVPKGEDVMDASGTMVIGRRPAPPLAAPNGVPPWVTNNDPSMLYGMGDPFPDDEVEFFLEFGTVNLGTIRTDPGQAENFAKAVIDTQQILLPRFQRFNGPSEFPQRVMSPGVGLQMVTIDITEQFYDKMDAMVGVGPMADDTESDAQRAERRAAYIADNFPANLIKPDGDPVDGLFNADGTINRDLWNGYRVPGAEANLGYRPRTLNGMWASPPYLHNGSIPNIYALLSPYDERPQVFYTGSREYDPEKLGYKSGRFKGGFRYDTSKKGNSNYGHLFQEGPPGDGIIGPRLTADDRLAVIEFLKTLCPAGFETNAANKTDPSVPVCVELPRDR